LRQSGKDYKRIVIKIGSSLLYSDRRILDSNFVENIVGQVATLIRCGIEAILVSSGAIAGGMHVLKFSSRPKELSSLQALAAVGQHFLMSQYRKYFLRNKLECAQILLTWEDLDDRKRYLNARNTLLKLLRLNSVPIINENDTVSTDEIKFGDNDQLSARVACLVNADFLIILSDVDGLLDGEKRVIRLVDEITPQIKRLAHPTDKKSCVGGMITKIEAAKIAMGCGIPCVIANGRTKNIISSVLNGPEKYGTLFVAKKGLSARERWIAFGPKPKGNIVVDDGAKGALLNKKSLLSVGITALEGNFEQGDIVSVMNKEDYEFARGKVGISAKQLDKIKGSRYDKEIIHRDNIVIL